MLKVCMLRKSAMAETRTRAAQLRRRILAQMPPEGFLTNSVGFLLAKCLQRVHAVGRPLLEESGLTPQQLMLLFGLLEAEHQTQSQLSERIGMDRTTLMRIVDRLEESGFVERLPDEQDRRVRRLVLTEQALRAMEAMVARRREYWERIFAPLEEAERLELLRLLRKLRDNGTTEREGDASWALEP